MKSFYILLLCSVPIVLASHSMEKSIDELLAASEHGYSKDVKRLIDAKVDVNCCDCKGRTAVCLAVKSGSVQSVQFLLDSNALPVAYQQESKTGTLLHVAAAGKSLEIVHLFVDSNDFSICDEKNRTPLLRAIQSGNKSIVDIVLPKDRLYQFNIRYKTTALMVAVRCAHLDVLRRLLYSKNIDISLFKDLKGNTLLSVAEKYARKQTEKKKDYAAIVEFLSDF